MISKRIPGKASDLAVVLIVHIASVSQHYIRINPVFQCFEPDLDLLALLREESVAKAITSILRLTAAARKSFADALASCSCSPAPLSTNQ
jgi:hypothetical protein